MARLHSTIFLLICVVSFSASCYSELQWRHHSSIDGHALYSVSAYDSRNIWVGGAHRTTHVGSIFYHDGSSWQQQADSEYLIRGISAVSPTNAWAVGDSGDLGRIYFYDGEGWSIDAYTIGACNDVVALASGEVWVAGWELFYNDGSSWEVVSDVGGNSMAFVDPQHIWTTGGTRVFFFDGKESVLQTQIPTSVSLPRFGISAVDENNVWVTPNGGDIYYYDGNTWEIQHSFGGDHRVDDIIALAPDDVWAVGLFGRIYHYDGIVWSDLGYYEEVFEFLDINVSADGNLWAVGFKGYEEKSYIFTTAPIPEPSTVLLILTSGGLAALKLLRHRR